MEGKAQEILLKLMERALSGIDEAIKFGQTEIPLVIQELLWWEGVSSFIWFSVAWIIIAVGAALILKPERPKKIDPAKGEAKNYTPNQFYNEHGTPEDLTNMMRFFGVLTSILGVAILLNSLEWFKILVAPRLFLIEYAADLARTVGG